MIDWRISNPESTLVIEQTSNGFIVTRFSTYDETDEFHSIKNVIEMEELDGFEPDFDGVEKLLWQILEDFEIWNSKYHNKRIEISAKTNKEE